MVQFFANSIVKKTNDDDTAFPSHRFDLFSFDKLGDRKGLDTILTDVIGRIIGEGKTQVKNIRGKVVSCLMLDLEDIWGKTVRITLWDNCVDEYFAQRSIVSSEPIVGVFTSNLVKEYNSAVTLSSTSDSKIYLNLQINEVAEFKNNYKPIGNDDSIKALNVQGTEIDREFVLSNKKSIGEILDIVKTDFIDGIQYFCVAKISDINNNKGWYYNSCQRCKRLIKPAGEKFWCNKCQQVVDDAIPRYRLELQVVDDSNNTKFILFDEVAEKLIGQSAASVYDMEEKNEDEDSEGGLLAFIECLIGGIHVFRVKLTNYNKSAYIQSFTANKVLEKSIIAEPINMEQPVVMMPSKTEASPPAKLTKRLRTKSKDRVGEDTSSIDVGDFVDIGDDDLESQTSTKKRSLRIVESDEE